MAFQILIEGFLIIFLIQGHRRLLSMEKEGLASRDGRREINKKEREFYLIDQNALINANMTITCIFSIRI